MRQLRCRLAGFAVISSAALLATGCDEAEQIFDTIRLALGIANVWT